MRTKKTSKNWGESDPLRRGKCLAKGEYPRGAKRLKPAKGRRRTTGMAFIGLRVLSGKYKGRRLASPQSRLTHPMGSREKNALFNMLTGLVAGAKVLDLYAGSGALGIEALSRGAKSVIFVEKSPKIAKIIRKNLERVKAKAEVFVESTVNFAQNPRFQGHFSVVIADPPYDGFREGEIVLALSTLATGGVLALSFPAERGAPQFPGMELLSERHYAGAGIAIYKK